jgi:hypothetical protein
MRTKRIVWSGSCAPASSFLRLLLLVSLSSQVHIPAQAQDELSLKEANNQIRRDKFNLVLPGAMRENDVDMWIHVVREAIPDSFGAEELGSTSGVFVFTDRGRDRIERAILGRRWGASQRQEEGAAEHVDVVEALGAYDIVGEPVFVREPLGGPMTEYDYRFKGLGAFVAARDPQRIAVNFKQDLAQWPTYRGQDDGISHSDYLLLAQELGARYADRLVSSEYVLMDYMTRKVPREVELLRSMRQDEIARVNSAFAAVVPGVTKTTEFGRDLYYAGATVLRRMSTGLSQRGRSAGWENSVIQGGDILAAEGVGRFAYVLRDGETEPPEEIQELWAQYLKIDRILAETIRAGRTPREMISDYTRKFEDEGIIVRADQLHMVSPKNDFPAYSAGFDPDKTHLTIDAHGETKGARERVAQTYFAPRIGSYGPDWSKDIPLAPNHHFVLEYFFYMPSPASEGEDQYLLWWDHEGTIATESGVEYLSPPQEELYLIH